MKSTKASAEARLRRHARAADEIIKKSRREIGHQWRGGYYRYLVVNAQNLAVCAGDNPEDLIRRYLPNALADVG